MVGECADGAPTRSGGARVDIWGGHLIVVPQVCKGVAVRPKAIVYFEWIIFGTLLLGVLRSYLGWDRVIAQTATTLGRSSSFAIAFTLIVMILTFVVFGTLTLLVSRRRSKIAMWISIALFALGLLSFVQTIGALFASNIIPAPQYIDQGVIIPALQTIGQTVAYGLLFTPSARRWMKREDEKAA
jgi:MFS family permease